VGVHHPCGGRRDAGDRLAVARPSRATSARGSVTGEAATLAVARVATGRLCESGGAARSSRRLNE
jgi:hypothetical protein